MLLTHVQLKRYILRPSKLPRLPCLAPPAPGTGLTHSSRLASCADRISQKKPLPPQRSRGTGAAERGPEDEDGEPREGVLPVGGATVGHRGVDEHAESQGQEADREREAAVLLVGRDQPQGASHFASASSGSGGAVAADLLHRRRGASVDLAGGGGVVFGMGLGLRRS